MTEFLLGICVVLVVTLFVAASLLVRERDQWRSYAEGLNERIDTELGVER